MNTVVRHTFGWPATLLVFIAVVLFLVLPTTMSEVTTERERTIDSLQMQIDSLREQIEAIR